MCVLLCCERSSEHGSREPWLCVLFIALAQCEWHQAGHGAAAEVPIGGSEGERRAEETPAQGHLLAVSLGRQAEESNLNYSQSWVVLLENSERIYCTWHLLLAPAFNCGQTDILSSWKQRFYCLNTMCVRGERERECVHTYGWHVPNTLKLLPRI